MSTAHRKRPPHRERDLVEKTRDRFVGFVCFSADLDWEDCVWSSSNAVPARPPSPSRFHLMIVNSLTDNNLKFMAARYSFRFVIGDDLERSPTNFCHDERGLSTSPL